MHSQKNIKLCTVRKSYYLADVQDILHIWNMNFRHKRKAVFFTLLIHVNLNMQVFRLSLRLCSCACSSKIWLCGTEWWVSNISRQRSDLIFKDPISYQPLTTKAVCYLKTFGTNHTMTQHYTLEVWTPQT